MGWVRSRKGIGGRLALFALALQIVLSFGHVHLHGLRDSAQAVAHLASAQTSHRGPAQTPADDDDYCAICASIFLVSTSIAAAPPILPLPTGFVRIVHSRAATHANVLPRRFAFQSRAPPSA